MRIRTAIHPLSFGGYKFVLKVCLIMLFYRVVGPLIAKASPWLFTIYTANSIKIITLISNSILLCLQVLILFLIYTFLFLLSSYSSL